MQIIEPTERLHTTDQGLIVENTQAIGDEVFRELNETRDNFKFNLDGLTPVASIPAAVVNRWLREGFDFYNAPAQEIKIKLKLEEMSVFDTSYGRTF